MIKSNINIFLKIEKTQPLEKINIYGSVLRQNSLKKLLNQSKFKNENQIVNENQKDLWVAPSLNHNKRNDDNNTKIHLLLTQLTEKNKDQIFQDILVLVKKDINLCDSIYKSAILQDYYSNIYSKLCVFLRDKIKDRVIFEKKILNFLEIFFKNRLKLDNKYQNYIKFISYLHLNNFISKKIIDLSINSIILNLQNENINCSEEISSLYNIYLITKIKIKDEYVDIFNKLSEDKNKIKLSKDRFKFYDILELN